jgi:hypothetical protein
MKITTIQCDQCGYEYLNEEAGYIELGSLSGKDLKFEIVGAYKNKFLRRNTSVIDRSITLLEMYSDLHFCNHDCFYKFFGKSPVASEIKNDSNYNNLENSIK